MELNSLRVTKLKQWKRVKTKGEKGSKFCKHIRFQVTNFYFLFKTQQTLVEVYLT